jgi:hypothetical protein
MYVNVIQLFSFVTDQAIYSWDGDALFLTNLKKLIVLIASLFSMPGKNYFLSLHASKKSFIPNTILSATCC